MATVKCSRAWSPCYLYQTDIRISTRFGNPPCPSCICLTFELFGEAGLQHRIQNQHYPEALKRQAVEAYLSAILDLYGRNIVAFFVSRKNDTALVLDTFERAFPQCYDDGEFYEF